MTYSSAVKVRAAAFMSVHLVAVRLNTPSENGDGFNSFIFNTSNTIANRHHSPLPLFNKKHRTALLT